MSTAVTVEEAEHQIATRLYQKPARIHFNQYVDAQGRFGRRLIYGGHVISLAPQLTYNGFANAFHVTAINGGRHVAPLFAGATVVCLVARCWHARASGRADVGALRVRTIATRIVPATISRTSRATRTIRRSCWSLTTGCSLPR
jgi:2-methylfumaryl-CoA hydratase